MAWRPYFNTWTLSFYKERYVLCYTSPSCLQNVCCDHRRKNYISGYIWPRSFIQTVKCSFLHEKNVYQSFYGVPLTFSYCLLQGKVLCFTHVAKCDDEMFFVYKAFRRTFQKYYIFSYIWQKSFIQTAKCSFYNQVIVYQSFSGTLLTFSYFLLPGICLARIGKNDQSVVML